MAQRRNLSSKLRFKTWDEWRLDPQAQAYRVMVFTPRGQYPRGVLRVPNGVFYADKNIVFAVVHSETWRSLDPDTPYSEFDWAMPQELRFLASMMYCQLSHETALYFYPIVQYRRSLHIGHLDLSSDDTVAAVRRLLLDKRQRIGPRSQHKSLLETKSQPYALVSQDRFVFDRLGEFWRGILPRNYVLLRGTYALLKGDMLARHYEFMEEAVIVTFIALEASLELVRRHLQSKGIKDPSAIDAQKWLHETFDAPFDLPEVIDRYFEEFYDQRIMTMHPKSRFGEMPYAPLSVDDFFHLRTSIREIFAYLVSGRHAPDFDQRLAEHRARWPQGTYSSGEPSAEA